MRVGADDIPGSTVSDVAPRSALRSEITDAIEGIVDRDQFLQRIARKVVEVTRASGVAIYVRSSPGSDLVLRASTLPHTEPIPVRVSPDAWSARDEIIIHASAGTDLRLDVQTTLLQGATESIGILAMFSWSDEVFSEDDQRALAEAAAEVSPAIAVAEHHHAIKQASMIDPLTGACTVRYLTRRFDEEIARAHRSGTPVTVVLMRILDFEDVQRLLGYSRADSLLRELSTEFSGLFRVFDVVAIRSRSEFAILLPDTDLLGAGVAISRAHRRLARVTQRFSAECSELTLRAVTGAAAFPDDGDRASTMMLVAEHRLVEDEVLLRRATALS
jgi:diguanylate cyclase (GGDEF)-like protein